MNKLLNISSKLKTIVHRCILKLKKVYCILKKQLAYLQDHGYAILTAPNNPCASCDAELQSNIIEQYQLGRSVTVIESPCKKEHCLNDLDAKKQSKPTDHWKASQCVLKSQQSNSLWFPIMSVIHKTKI